MSKTEMVFEYLFDFWRRVIVVIGFREPEDFASHLVQGIFGRRTHHQSPSRGEHAMKLGCNLLQVS